MTKIRNKSRRQAWADLASVLRDWDSGDGSDRSKIAERMVRIWEGSEPGKWSDRARMAAGYWLADRAYGKAVERTENLHLSMGAGTALTDAQLIEVARSLKGLRPSSELPALPSGEPEEE